MTEITVRCAAKVNLTLDILGLRPDGYHNLESIMQSVSISDVLHIRHTDEEGVSVTSSDLSLHIDYHNTVYRACTLFMKATDIKSGISARIEKHLPAKAGLGGGSSDAAGALAAMNKLFGDPLEYTALLDIAAIIGSDVPYFLIGGTALVRGRGELVERLPDAPTMNMVIAKPDVGIPTKWAYGKLDEDKDRKSIAATAKAVECINAQDREALIRTISNDFDTIVVKNNLEIAGLRRTLIEMGAEASLLCGSGAAVFGIFSDGDAALSACSKLKDSYPFAVAVRTVPSAIEIGESSIGY
jgi:4-diphosphocytidyl-2-C-methyl-D-erythritol kinase